MSSNQTKVKVIQETPSWAWIILIINAAILAWAPFDNALFFDNAFIWSALLISIASVVTAILFRMRVQSVKGWMLTDKLALAIVGTYLISTFGAANYEYALVGDVRALAIAAMYFAARLLSSLKLGQAVTWALTLIGAAVGLYAFGNGFGTIHHNGGIFDPAMRRLAGSFEYPNTLASFVSGTAILSISILYITKNRWIASLQYVLAFLSLSTLILTESRGAWVVTAAALVLMWIFSAQYARLAVIVRSIVTLIVTVGATPLLRKAVVAQSAKGWIWIVVGCVAAYVLGNLAELIIARYLNRRLQLKILLPVLIVIGVIGALGGYLFLRRGGGHTGGLLGRLSTINLQQFSVVQRLLFYKDGLRMFTDHPILGHGYNTWMATNEHYKSYPYNSNQAHSFIIDVLIDTGAVGILVWITFLIAYLKDFKKALRNAGLSSVKSYLAGVSLVGATLLLHSAMDFDFSYAYMNFIFFICAGLTVPALAVAQKPSNYFSRKQVKSSVFFDVASMVVGIIVFVFSGGYLLSDVQIAKANANSMAPNTSSADAATALAPYRAAPRMISASAAANAYQKSHPNTALSSDITTAAETAVGLAPYDSQILMTAANIEASSGHLAQAVDLAKRSMDDSIYRMNFTESYMMLADQIGTYLNKSNPSQANQIFKDAIAAYNGAEQRIAEFSKLPPVLHLEYPYAITDNMRLNVAECYLYTKDYAGVHKAVSTLLSQASDTGAKAKILDAVASVKQGSLKDYPALKFSGANAQTLQAYYDQLKNLK